MLDSFLLVVWLSSHGAAPLPQSLAAQLQTGDIVFHTSSSRQSAAIRAATESPFSHMGLVEVTPQGVFVVEAVQPVQRVPFAKWKARGRKGHILVMRPEGLTEEQRQAALAAAKRHLGKPYDWSFGWGDDALYCSELVRKAYTEAAGVEYGQLQRLDSLKVEKLGRELRERYRGKVPLDLELISPASLAADPRLNVVYSDFPPAR